MVSEKLPGFPAGRDWVSVLQCNFYWLQSFICLLNEHLLSSNCVPDSVLNGIAIVVSVAVASTYSWLAFLLSLSSTGSPPIPEFPDCIKAELAVGMDSTLGWCQDADKLFQTLVL